MYKIEKREVKKTPHFKCEFFQIKLDILFLHVYIVLVFLVYVEAEKLESKT